MIYIIPLFCCLCLAWVYDVMGCTKNKTFWYFVLLFWFIALSGLQYMVGADLPEYVSSYARDYNYLSFDVGDIGGRFQPGWVLLSFLCRHISTDFLLFKLIQAIFVNVAIFSFFKRETKYVFLCILIYALTSFLLINFNILRQSFAIGFVLYFISAIKRNEYVKSLIFIFLAFMFHNSAILALFIPLFKLLKYNKRLLTYSAVFVLFLIFLLLRIDLEMVLEEFIGSQVLGDNISELGSNYITSEKFAVRGIKLGIRTTVRIMLAFVTVFFFVKKKKDLFFGGIGITYMFLLIINLSFPIIMRFRLYFDMPFYIMLSVLIAEASYGRLNQLRRFFAITIFVIYSYYPYEEYMTKYDGSFYRYLDQYYPYTSIFNPKDVDHKKIRFFN